VRALPDHERRPFHRHRCQGNAPHEGMRFSNLTTFVRPERAKPVQMRRIPVPAEAMGSVAFIRVLLRIARPDKLHLRLVKIGLFQINPLQGDLHAF
jgi:hypothetical protein